MVYIKENREAESCSYVKIVMKGHHVNSDQNEFFQLDIYIFI